LRKLGAALDLVSKLSEPRFEVVGFLEFTNALCELAERRVQISNAFQIIDLALTRTSSATRIAESLIRA
jgi:hypothetical protein